MGSSDSTSADAVRRPRPRGDDSGTVLRQSLPLGCPNRVLALSGAGGRDSALPDRVLKPEPFSSSHDGTLDSPLSCQSRWIALQILTESHPRASKWVIVLVVRQSHSLNGAVAEGYRFATLGRSREPFRENCGTPVVNTAEERKVCPSASGDDVAVGSDLANLLRLARIHQGIAQILLARVEGISSRVSPVDTPTASAFCDGWSFTDRERHVAALLVEGLSNRRIARRLEISERTVKNHLHSIFYKLNVSDRTQAVIRLMRKA
ncbi:helix-turn-helix domain-containing protein [Saccharothrix sp. Mg75]|uniref:helix-turn-helix domain-containing protein n=1 Tax=Saccharothrix sp. Mg75 TaxID=3445357 RepID=UPI003EEF55A8